MPKFLNHLDLNGNQLKNTKLEITDSPLAEEGVIHYHDTNNTVRYYNGSSFVTLGDNDDATTSAAGIVKLRYSVGSTPAAVAQTTTSNRTYGVTANSSNQLVVNVPWVDTTIANTDTFRTVSLDTNGDGSVNNTLTTTEDLVLKKGSNITLAEVDGVVTISSTDTNTQLNNAGVIGKVLTGLDTSSGSTVAAADTILAAFGKLENRVAANDLKVTNSTIAARLAGTGITLSTNTFNVNVGATGTTQAPQSITTTANRLYQVETDDQDNLVVNIPWSDTTIANTDVDVSVDNLETRLGEINSNVTIGNATSVDTTISGDLTVTGDLLVSGATTTLDVTTLDVEDKNITVAKGAASAAAADGAGLTVDGASATLLYRSTGDKFVFNKALEATSFSGALTLTDLDIDGGTALGAAPDSTDLMIVDDGANGTNKSMTVANLQTYMQNSLTFTTNTNTIDMGDGFIVSADTNTATTTITENDTLTIAGGTGISTVSNPDGTITITNDINNTNQLTNGANFITSSSNITGTAAGITAGAVGAVAVFELDHGATGVVANNTTNNSDVFTITHGMGSSRFYKVEVVLDSGNYDTVYVDVTRPSDTTIVVTFGSVVANGAYRAMITRMA